MAKKQIFKTQIDLFEAFKQFPGNIYCKNLDGVIIAGNDHIVKTAGLKSIDELIGKKDEDFLDKKIANQIRSNDLQVISAKKTLYFEEKIEFNGQKLILLSIKSPLFDDQGHVIGVVGVSTDITHRPLSQLLFLEQQKSLQFDQTKLLQLSKQITGQSFENISVEEFATNIINYYENIISCMPGNIFWMDKNCVYLGCNDNAAKMVGFNSRYDIVGKTDLEIAQFANWGEGQAESFRQDDLEVLRTGLPKMNVEEPPIPNIDGNTLYFLSSRVPLQDKSGNVMGLVGVSVDITAQKQAEQALVKAKEEADKANKAKSDFLAMMTHELRTPLNVIMGMVQVMQHENCSEEQKQDYYQAIMRSSKSLLGLINDILDFSKAQSGKLQIQPEPFELQPLLNQLQVEFSVKGQQHGTQFLIEKDPEIPAYLVADEQRLRQIIYNLTDNAMKFTQFGKVTLKLTRTVSQTPGYVGLKIEVIDTGIGIPKDKLETVFEQFTQISLEKHSEYSRKYGGVGLGLSIVKYLINLMHGRISINSELGKGTTFTCDFEFPLPTKAELNLITEQTLKHEMDQTRKLTTRKVLLVEDNLLNQKVAAHMLHSLHCKVEIANDGSEALAKMQMPYDIVFMDMSLPDMSGLEVTEQFRKKESPNRHQKIIALTANIHADDQQKCLAAGMDDFLSKPIMYEELKDIIISL